MRNEPRLFTNQWRIFSLVVFLVASMLTVAAKREGNSATTVSAAQPRKGAVVFAVSAESGEGSMDAVVIVDGKQLRTPYTDEQKDKQKSFGNEYFAPGKVYRLIFGGGEAGTVTVKKWSEGCNNIHAELLPHLCGWAARSWRWRPAPNLWASELPRGARQPIPSGHRY